MPGKGVFKKIQFQNEPQNVNLFAGLAVGASTTT